MNVDEYVPVNGSGESVDDVPHSNAAEQALLGALMENNVAMFSEVRDIVKDEDFYNPVHRQIYTQIRLLSRRGQLANAIVLKNRFSQDDLMKQIGGVQYLADLLLHAPSGAAVTEYARMISDLAARRKLIGLGRGLLYASRDTYNDNTADELIDEARTALDSVQGTLPASASFISLQDAAREAVEIIGKGRPMGLPTGYDELDDKLAGLGRGKLITIAGRPSMGKTALATNIARNIATSVAKDENGAPITGKVGFFSQEMPAIELGERAAAAALGPKEQIEYRDITAHNVTSTQKAKLLAGIAKIPHIMVDETAGLTYSEIEKRARALEKQLGGLDVLVVDYLQLMEGTDSPDPRNDVKYYGWIANNFKTLAKKMNIAVVLLSQLSRKVEERENQRPRKSDLKGSGTIEDASDVILFVFRPEIPLIEKGEPVKQDQKERYFRDLNWAKGRMEIIVGKNKGGPLGTISLRAFMGYDVITEYADPDGEGFDEQIPF